jgi:serine/threonine protein phosphatase 1
MTTRTFAIGDVHGDLSALEALLAKLPELYATDTLVFLGDYVDRGPDSAGVIRRVREMAGASRAKVIALRGNHEDMWLECFEEPNLGFLLARGNGCANTYRSFTQRPPLNPDDPIDVEELLHFGEVKTWFPRDVLDWMRDLPLWYEDEHAVYVHAGLEGDGLEWKHPSQCAPKPLMWMREQDFFKNYRGKRLIFGHTPVRDLPVDHLGLVARLLDDRGDVWVRGDLVGVDTGCGKGGFLSAIELPAMKIYESR